MTEAAEADELAFPLDTLLVEAGLGPAQWLLPDRSTAKFLGKLLSKPGVTGRRLSALAAELARIGAGTSEVAASQRDRRFSDEAWTSNPLLHRILQAYLTAARTAEDLVGVADLGWQDDRRVRFLLQNLTEAASPSNIPLVNPASAKEAVNTEA